MPQPGPAASSPPATLPRASTGDSSGGAPGAGPDSESAADARAAEVCTPLDAVRGRALVRVVAVSGDDALASRLQAMGFWPDTLVEPLAKAPLGDPLLFRLHGFRFALRRSEAARVLVAAVDA